MDVTDLDLETRLLGGLLFRALTGHRGWYLLPVVAVVLATIVNHYRSRQRIWREFDLRFDASGHWRRRIDYHCALRSQFPDVQPHLASPVLAAAWFPRPEPPPRAEARAPVARAAPSWPTDDAHLGARRRDPWSAWPTVWSWSNPDGTASGRIGLHATSGGTQVVVRLETINDRTGRRLLRALHPIVHQGLQHLDAELGR